MKIPTRLTPLLVSAVRDAVRYQDQLMRSETLRNRDDYEEHYLQLTQLFEFIKDEYKRIEGEAGIPLKELL